MHVLVADDNTELLPYYAAFLSNAGFTVLLAESGRKALELFAEHYPPLICLDVCMPDMLGTEVCQRIRRLDDTVWILLMTGLALGADKRCKAYELGADDYLERPFEMGEFVVRVNAGARRIRATPPNRAFPFGDALVEPRERMLKHGALEVPLTEREVNLLRYFADRPGEPCRARLCMPPAGRAGATRGAQSTNTSPSSAKSWRPFSQAKA